MGTVTRRATLRPRVRKGSASARTARQQPGRAPAARQAPSETPMVTEKQRALFKRCAAQEHVLSILLLLREAALLAMQAATSFKTRLPIDRLHAKQQLRAPR